MEIYYYIGGIEVNRPLNYKELSIELNWDFDNTDNNAISLTEFEWGLGSQVSSNDAASIINLHRSNGISSGVGVFEGLPFRIVLTNNGTTKVLFDGYLNTSSALFDCDKVIVSSMKKGSVDWLNEVADGVSFDYLYEKTNLRQDFVFISVPYVLNSIPDNKEALLSTMSLSFIIITIATQIEELVELLIDLPNIVVTVNTAIKLALRIIYIIGLLLILFNLVLKIIDLLIQPLKYHDAMTVKNLCEIGAKHFGFTFESSILNSSVFVDKLVIMPEKFSQAITNTAVGGIASDIIGFLNPNSTTAKGYYKGTFGELLRSLKETFNAKIIIEGTVLKLEREDYNNSSYNYVLPQADQTQYRLNFFDLKSNYIVEFLTDINDKTTLINYEGTLTQATTSPVSVINKGMVLMTSGETRNTSFARGNRKKTLTNVEVILGSFLQQIDAVIDAFTDKVDEVYTLIAGTAPAIGIPSLYDLLIGDRIGMLLIENDIIDVAKLMLIDENSIPASTKVRTDNDSIINSEYLYNNYHFLRSFAITSTRPNGNQYKIYSIEGIPFCYDDYILLENNNRLQDSDGRNGEVLSCQWNIEEQTADIEYKINEAYTNNISVEVVTRDGK